MEEDLRFEIVDLIEDMAGAARVCWNDEKALKRHIKELLDGFMENNYAEHDG